MGKVKTYSIQQQLINEFNSLTYKQSPFQVWQDFITMTACMIANSVDRRHFEKRETLYLNIAKKYTKDELHQFAKMVSHIILALEENPEQDFLGAIFETLQLGNGRNGQFFTPYYISKLMAEIQISDKTLSNQLKEKGFITVNDCAYGAGSLLIAFANTARNKKINYQKQILFIGQDIDFIPAMMCYIQLSLLGCAGYVLIGDTLANPPTTSLNRNDTVWYMPMYFSREWQWRQIFSGKKKIG